MDQGYLQVYTGNGKGKTTCMLGLALRAVGANKQVYIGQFLKEDDYSEIRAIRTHLPQITVEQYGAGIGFVQKGKCEPKHREAAQAGLRRATEVLTCGQYDLVILDEINVAVFLELLEEKEVLALIDQRPATTELVLTGRYATQTIIDRADLVTEMREIKHYYHQGVAARVGIEK